MANFYPALTSDFRKFIAAQPVFFAASAAAAGRVNLSPKGMDTFRVIDEKTVGYLDFVGSGNETSAHIQHDGRLTIMFCSFDAKPLILRLYGRGEVLPTGSPRRATLLELFPTTPGERQIILLHVESVQTSCGWGVPRMSLIEPRRKLLDWAKEKGPQALADYQVKKNRKSIDGLPISLGHSTDQDA